jgi:hypothetical protein
VAPPVFKTGLAANTVAGGFDSLPPPPIGNRGAAFVAPNFRGKLSANDARWTERFINRLALSEPQTPSPEERPAERPAVASHVGVAGASGRSTVNKRCRFWAGREIF